MRRLAVATTLVLILAAGVLPAFSQDHVPAPYTPGEFPAWINDLWRAEAIVVGSFPFSLFATLEVYDTWRYIANGLKPGYTPWPIGSGAAVPYTAQETAWLAVSALSVSLVISGIDFMLGRLDGRAASR